MRLAVISDIHGNLTALDAVLQDLEAVGELDLIWCLGDFSAWGPRPAECVARLREQQAKHGKDKFKVIGGNTDRYIVTGKRPSNPPAKDEAGFAKRQTNFVQRDDLLNWALAQYSWEDYDFVAKTIGRELYTRVEGYGDVIGYHGIPGDDDSPALNTDTPQEEAEDALLDRSGRLAIGGHTHQMMDRQLGGWRAINPGSVGLSFDDLRLGHWALIEFDKGEAEIDFRKVPYDLEAVKADLATVSYPHPEWFTRFLK